MQLPERGITVTAGELACEGVDPVLDAVAATGANAITIPTGMVIEAANGGSREPPFDVDGERRRLDRPLWGKRVLNVHRLPVHDADPALWRDLPWAPPVAAPIDIRVDYARQAIAGARSRNLRVYAHITPFGVPGVPAGQDNSDSNAISSDDFRPQRLTGGAAPQSVAVTGCLNHPDMRALARVRILELLRHYGDVDGISVDWTEYPVYFIEELFTCFCDHCHAAADAHGHDWGLICHGVRGVWDAAHTLTRKRVRAAAASGDWGDVLLEPDAVQAGINAWLNFKADSAARALQEIRDAMREAGAADQLLSANSFALPWGRMSGADYPTVGRVVDSLRPKLYSFHWRMMVRWWSDTVRAWNRDALITPEEVTALVLAIFGMTPTDNTEIPSPEMFGMPGPDDHHQLIPESYTDRLENALLRRDDQAPYLPIVHGYRSVDDFAQLLEAVRPYTSEGMWVQRYGYLRDEKLDLLRHEWNRSS